MKNILAGILLIFYFGSAFGATVHLHYCMGQVVNISVSDTGDSACPKCGMESYRNKTDCCKDIKVVKKAADTHQSAHAYTSVTVSKAFVAENGWSEKRVSTPLAATVKVHQEHSPPDIDCSKLYIEYRNFRI